MRWLGAGSQTLNPKPETQLGRGRDSVREWARAEEDDAVISSSSMVRVARPKGMHEDSKAVAGIFFPGSRMRGLGACMLCSSAVSAGDSFPTPSTFLALGFATLR